MRSRTINIVNETNGKFAAGSNAISILNLTKNYNFSEKNLSNLYLPNAFLKHSNFEGADLSNSNLRNSELSYSNFRKANL